MRPLPRRSRFCGLGHGRRHVAAKPVSEQYHLGKFRLHQYCDLYPHTAPTYTVEGNPPNTTYFPITCQACHDPHNASNPNQLRMSYNVTLSDGTLVTNAGAGGFCMECHNSRNGSVTNMLAKYPLNQPNWAGGVSFGTHDSPQGDMLEGVNAVTYGQTIPSAPHAMVVSNTCVGCHMQTDRLHRPGVHAGRRAYHQDELHQQRGRLCSGDLCLHPMSRHRQQLRHPGSGLCRGGLQPGHPDPGPTALEQIVHAASALGLSGECEQLRRGRSGQVTFRLKPTGPRRSCRPPTTGSSSAWTAAWASTTDRSRSACSRLPSAT